MAGRGDSGSSGSFLGSLKDALAAASRTDSRETQDRPRIPPPSEVSGDGLKDVTEAARQLDRAASDATAIMSDDQKEPGASPPPPLPASAAEAAREARGGRPNIPPVRSSSDPAASDPPTTRVVRDASVSSTAVDAEPARTELVRGRQKVQRGDFKRDPVVGWLVVVGGPGLGAFRPVFEGNNTVGRGANNRIPIDFGDEAISHDEQAYIRYDSADRSFLLVPNLSKTNVVALNEKRPTQAVPLAAMDVITMGRTQLVFVPFCGADFDWSDLSELAR